MIYLQLVNVHLTTNVGVVTTKIYVGVRSGVFIIKEIQQSLLEVVHMCLVKPCS